MVFLEAPGYGLSIRRQDRLSSQFRLIGVGCGVSTMGLDQEGCLGPVAGTSFMLPGKLMLVGFATVLLTIAVEGRGKPLSVGITIVGQLRSDC